MELHQVSEPLGDPFFDVVHRRHPDIDLVLLPPEGPPAPAVVEPAVVVATLDRVASLAARLWGDATPEGDVTPRARLAYGRGPGTVRATARLTLRRPDGFEVLVALRHTLESAEWQVTRPPGEVERLLAHLDDLTVTASYAEGSGALMFELASESMPVGEAAARDLTRAPAGGR
jgi:hypothetical protein